MSQRFEDIDFTTLSTHENVNVIPAMNYSEEGNNTYKWLTISVIVVAGVFAVQQYRINRLKKQQNGTAD